VIALAIGALLIAILCYGFAGVELHSGSNDAAAPTRSRAWWRGTGLQAVGFLALLVARISLPLLLVQACASAGLAVTALIQHLRRIHRLGRSDFVAVLTVVTGLGLIAATVESSAAAGITITLIGLIAGGLVAAGIGLLVRLPGVASGALSGLGFGMAAVAARLVVGDRDHPVWLLWRLPAANWTTGVLAAAAIVCGQLHLSRGLRGRAAAPVLGTNYLVATVLPAVIGFAAMDETPRPGTFVATGCGLVAAMLGIGWLLLRGGLDDRSAGGHRQGDQAGQVIRGERGRVGHRNQSGSVNSEWHSVRFGCDHHRRRTGGGLAGVLPRPT
jgi:hypothetical protein